MKIKNNIVKRISIIFFLYLLILVLLSCQSVQTESGIKKQFSNIQAEQEESRLRLNEYALHFTGEVTTAADEIKSKTDNLEIKQNALLWKINSIPAAYKVLFTIDPYAAGIDMWVFARQMHLFFENGDGKTLFGDQQIIAIEASKKLENEIYNIVTISVEDTAKMIANDSILEFAEKYPFHNLTFSRRSIIDTLVKYMANHDRNIATSVGNMETALSDLSVRLNIYYDQFPKIATWNIEYLTNEVILSGELDTLRKNISTLTNSLERLARESEQLDNLIDSGVIKSSEELDKLRTKIFSDLKSERETILSEINRERLETLSQLKEILNSSIDNASFQLEEIADYILIRFVVIIIIGYFVFFTTNRMFRGRKQN